jgi:hypothetical protein
MERSTSSPSMVRISFGPKSGALRSQAAATDIKDTHPLQTRAQVGEDRPRRLEAAVGVPGEKGAVVKLDGLPAHLG